MSSKRGVARLAQPHEGSQKPQSLPNMGRPARGELVDSTVSGGFSARRRPLLTWVSGNPPHPETTELLRERPERQGPSNV